MDFGNEPDGPVLAHEVRYPGELSALHYAQFFLPTCFTWTMISGSGMAWTAWQCTGGYGAGGAAWAPPLPRCPPQPALTPTLHSRVALRSTGGDSSSDIWVTQTDPAYDEKVAAQQ